MGVNLRILVPEQDQVHIASAAAAAASAALQAGTHRGDDARAGDRRKFAVELRRQRLGVDLASSAIRQHGVGAAAIVRDAPEARQRDRILREGSVLEQLRQATLDLLTDGQGVVVSRALRCDERDIDPTTVFIGHKLAGERAEQTRCRKGQAQHQGAGRQRRRPAAKQRLQGGVIGVPQPVHRLLDELRDQPFTGSWSQQPGRQHRRKAQRQDGREEHRSRNRDSELPEQAADIAGHEHQRREDADQHDRRRHHSEKDLPGAALRRDDWRLALIDPPLNVFHHHDGVIHDQPDRQHQGQQRQQIDGKAQRAEHDEGGENADRRDNRRDDRGARRAQEDEVHQRDQRQRYRHGDPDFLDRLARELREVDRHGQRRALRQGAVDFRDRLVDPVGDFQVIGLGLATDGDPDAILPIGPEQSPAFVRAFLHARDIAKAGDIFIGVGAAGNGGSGPGSRAGAGRCPAERRRSRGR